MEIPVAQLSTALDMAAQGHADYNAMSGILAHIEAFGNPGFIGVSFGDRAGYFGYDSPTSEDAHQLGDPSGAVDGWMNTLYHRAPIAAYLNTDIGYGLSLLNNKTMDVMDFGAKSSKAPATRAIVTYPANNQTDVPVAWSEESPDPFPGVPRPLGYPLSVHTAQPANATQGTDTVVTSGTLTDSNNQNVAVNFRDRNSDRNMFLRDEYFMVPQQPLNVGAKYQASVSGTETQGNSFNVSWSFTTVPASVITSVIPFSGTPNPI